MKIKPADDSHHFFSNQLLPEIINLIWKKNGYAYP